MDWNLFGCARRGHVTYAPDEPALHDRLRTETAAGEAWRCLRCGAFVPGATPGTGPAAAAPLIKRGKELRSEVILRVFAVERFLRFIVLGVAAYGVWWFRSDKAGVQRAFNGLVPAIRTLYRDLGFNINHSKLLGLINRSFTLSPRALLIVAILIAAYAIIELIEAVGLWLGKRWGEYFAMIATSVFIPYEVYELVDKVTWLRLVAFLINLALVAYLIWSKHLLGVRGGKRAYEAKLRGEAILEVEQSAQVPSAPPLPASPPPVPPSATEASAVTSAPGAPVHPDSLPD